MPDIDFYYVGLSPPCRAAHLTLKSVGVNYKKILTNPLSGETQKPEFLAINPQHCVPTIVDGDTTIWESRAIMTYLASKYGKDDTLYPKDLAKRANIDKLLYWDLGTLWYRFGMYAFPVVFKGQDKPDPERLDKVHDALSYINDLVEGKDFLTGNHITVADQSLLVSITGIEAAGVDISKHKNLHPWIQRCSKATPGYEDAMDGLEQFGNFFKAKLCK